MLLILQLAATLSIGIMHLRVCYFCSNTLTDHRWASGTWGMGIVLEIWARCIMYEWSATWFPFKSVQCVVLRILSLWESCVQNFRARVGMANSPSFMVLSLEDRCGCLDFRVRLGFPFDSGVYMKHEETVSCSKKAMLSC